MANWRERNSRFTSQRKDNVYSSVLKRSLFGSLGMLGAVGILLFGMSAGYFFRDFTLRGGIVSANQRISELEKTDNNFRKFATELQQQCDDSKKNDSKSYSRYILCAEISKKFPDIVEF